MANFLNGFFDNLLTGTLTPKGDMGDFRHAAYLYTANGFSLAPKNKFLYHVVFEIRPGAQKVAPQLMTRHRQEINMLVKSVDLPKFSVEIETKNQYNRKKNVQTAIRYDPISITMHDDNLGATTAMLEAYYRYYFKDGNHSSEGETKQYQPRSTYKPHGGRYGLDNGAIDPFFRKITIYQLSRHQYTGFTLVNPIITRWGHDNLDNSSNDVAANTMEVAYEAVFYSRGSIREGNPAGFATTYYDKTPSPNTIAGGGGDSFFGAGGILDGTGSILGDLTSGNFGLGTIIKGVNLFQNSKNLTLKGLRNEGLSVAEGIVGGTVGNVLNGVPNISFPKNSGTGGITSITNAVGGIIDVSSSQYAGKVAAARANNQG